MKLWFSVVTFSGVGFMLLGTLLLFNSVSGITGFVVSHGINENISFFLGTFLFVIGVLIFAVTLPRRAKESRLIEIADEICPSEDRKSCEILIDADFIKYLHTNGINLPEDFFGKYTHEMTSSVHNELTRRTPNQNHPLVPGKMVNYLTRRLNTKIKDFKPSEDQKDEILSIWRRYAPQGKERSNEGKFSNSGDMDMLCYALGRGENYTFILTNNYSEIGRVSEQLRKKGVNVYVVRPGEVFGEGLAA